MVHKYLSVLLLCSVPLIGMERKWSANRATDLRNNLKQVDEAIARIEEFEKGTGQDLSKQRSTIEDEAARIRVEYYVRTGDFIETSEDTSYVREQFRPTIVKAKEEQPAPSQVSPCLDTFEDYLKQPDTTLASNAVRDCIRKYVEFCRSNK